MAYQENMWEFEDSIEHEIHFMGRYGAKGEKRAARIHATPEQIRKQNQVQREKRLRRTIKANFQKNDLWLTLKYPAGTKKTIDEVKHDLRNFLSRLKRRYKKHDEELKFIYRIEIGSRGGVHCHMIVNRIRDTQTDVLIQDAWTEGRVNYESLYDQGGFDDLAKYLVKEPKPGAAEETEKLSPEDRKKIFAYSSSRNLIRPIPKKKYFKRRTLRKMIEAGITPRAGFYIVKDTVRGGINPFTGTSWLSYTEEKIKKTRMQI